MCGIAGILGRPGHELEAPMRRMLEALSHRGPDDSDSLVLPNGILGHTRLSIVDLSGGRQPMSSPGRDHHIVFNGEIYGYKALRKALGDFPYRTASDTEVILAAYARYGAGLVERLPGMFAFAIWDEGGDRLVCGRDRFGEKPFYFATPQPGVIVFASELKAILASGLVEPEIDPDALAYYFRRHYIHPWKTIYRNVASLPPGHRLTWDGQGCTVQRYWRVPEPNGSIYTLDSAAEQLRELTREAVRSQLVADVEIGAFLSGGLDSTTIVGTAVESAARLRTFCADFDGLPGDAPYARMAAERYGTEHVELRIGPYSLPDVLSELAGIYDEPFGDNSNVPTYLIAARAREHVKVVLTGDGGDEIFGGYGWYRSLWWAERNAAPSWGRWMTARMLARSARAMHLPAGEWLEQRNIGIGMMRRKADVLTAHVKETVFCDDAELVRLGLGDSLGEIESWDQPLFAGHGLAGAMNFDIQAYMPGDILVKLDRASMAHGLELRAPFLDVTLAEFVLSLPAEFRVTRREDKRILRAAFSESWPEPIRTRRKQGFGAPVGRWLESPELAPMVQACMLDPSAPINDLVDPAELKRRFSRAGPLERWAMFSLGLWAARWSSAYRVSG